MAEDLRRELRVGSELVPGDRGEFTVWVGDRKVASKRGDDFPPEDEVVDAVREALKRSA